MDNFPEPASTVRLFESGQIAAEHFDHEAHVYVAWCFVIQYPLADAVARFDSALRRVTDKLGVPEKYHATITWFFLLLVAERVAADEDWQSFKARNPDLFQESKATLERHYSAERLFSDAARDQFLLPDRTPT
jgi:hypothetical protein